ncbi:MAG: hydrogenase iron-sulfur subunit, partial [candidate division KSB1 bacterium]|nr:hydrogenase iron-sulfur subunit [candidate division KSB1 bacterium]
APLLADLETDNKVEMHAPATVNEVQGFVGNFKVELVQRGAKMAVEVGAIVVATNDRGTIGTGFEKSLALAKDKNGFYLSTQGILNLLDFTTEGVFNCGLARATLEIEDAVIDGEAAASRVATVLASPMMVKAPVISHVVEENCDGCAYCVEPCPTRTITLLEFMQRGEIKKVVEVNEATCIGCGICMATCPKKGIFVRHFKPEYFSAMVAAALKENDKQPVTPLDEITSQDKRPLEKLSNGVTPLDYRPLHATGSQGTLSNGVILSFCCNRCAYPGADAAGSAGIQYPTSVKIIRTVCTGMIHPNIIIDALTHGADGVLLCGCHPGNCRSREGIRKAQSRAESIALMLEDFGLEPERFRLEFIAASEGSKFAKVVAEMTEALSALGPNPYR